MKTKQIVVVTGATGFIGKNLIPRLLKEGYEVHAIVRSNKPIHSLKRKYVHRVDLSNRKLLKRILSRVRPTLIFHLGAYLAKGDSPKEIKHTYRSNILGTLSLLTATHQIPYTRFIFTGTYIQYGDQLLPYRETVNPTPLSCYAASKTAAEQYCMLFASYGKPITILRFGSTYGPFENPVNFIPSSINSILSGNHIEINSAKKTRDFIYVDDAIDALIKAAHQKKSIGQIINISSGRETSLIDVAKKIIQLEKSKNTIIIRSSSPRKNDALRMRGDITRAKTILGWHPKTSLEEGLRKTLKWRKQYHKHSL